MSSNISTFHIVECSNPKYVFLKVLPAKCIRNYNSDIFVPLVSQLYSSFLQRIEFDNNKIKIDFLEKVGFFIYMDQNNGKKKVEFYFVLPEKHFLLFRDKIIDTWSNRVTLSEVDTIPNFHPDCLKYTMKYEKTNPFSLTCDKRNNYLLSSQLNTLHIMEDTDKVGVFYNFIPTNNKPWKSTWDRTIETAKNGFPMEQDKTNFKYILKLTFKIIEYVCDTVLYVIEAGSKKKQTVKRELELSKATKDKRDKIVVDAQIVCLSDSSDKSRQKNNMLALCNSFDCLAEDNRLIYSPIRKRVDLLAERIKGAKTMKLQPKEAQNFISLPGRELLEEHAYIEHTSVLETEVPKLLRKGYLSLGMNVYRGCETEAFHRDNYDQGNFPLVALGEQGSGKSTYLTNYAKYAQRRDECVIVIDYIKNCELSDIIEGATPKDKLLVVDMSDVTKPQGFGYNEFKAKGNTSVDIIEIANRKAIYVQMLVDALNTAGDPLSSRMDRFLNAASNIVFIHPDSSLKDVVMCLNSHEHRHFYIDAIPNDLKPYFTEEVSILEELDELSKDGEPCGTKNSKVDGINHRIDMLKKDFRLKMMFNSDCSQNIDLVDAMDSGKIVLIKMPQEYFGTPYSKNVLVTYWLTKIWSALIIRGSKSSQPKRTHIIVDEIFQSKTAMAMLNDQEILPQTRKFGGKFIFSAQALIQLKTIDQTLRSAGASYMLMKGSGKANFSEFKDELYPYTLEDMEALPQYSSLNLINYEKGRAVFITKLPKPLKDIS